jgi:Nif-specific regulatory protein
MVLAITQTGDTMDSLKERIRDLEREEILNALRQCEWVMARAARRLGITERMIGYKIRKYGIRKESDLGVRFADRTYPEQG